VRHQNSVCLDWRESDDLGFYFFQNGEVLVTTDSLLPRQQPVNKRLSQPRMYRSVTAPPITITITHIIHHPSPTIRHPQLSFFVRLCKPMMDDYY
jgi:hypothetical protein